MKTLTFSLLAGLLMVPAAFGQKAPPDYSRVPGPPVKPPPSDFVVDPPPPPIAVQQPGKPVPVYVYDQKPAAGRQPLISPEQAQGIVNRFKAAYPKMGSPRFLIYVNRELVEQDQNGMKLVNRTETVETASAAVTNASAADTNAAPAVKSVEKNEYRADAAARPQPTLADKQTVRDVERLFGRPLRAAGASIVDQKVAAELIADRPITEVIGAGDSPQARKDREAVNKIADAVIEILISSKPATVATTTGEQTVALPDIQATVVSLKDAKIIGQASSAEVTANIPPAVLATYNVREITEATALALMQDMTPAPAQ
ncbi:MAG: hypothetical protein U1F98_08515 [Verrucomicrobiota bacterium]